VTIQTGAVWIDGYYGESDSPKTIGVSGNGMVVARMDPTGRTIAFYFVANQSTPTQSLSGIFEIPIMQITGTTGRDIRQYSTPSPSAPVHARVFRNGPYTTLNGSRLAFDTVSYGTGFSAGVYTCLYAADYLVVAQWGCTSQSTAFWMEANIVKNNTSVATSPPNTAPTLIGLQAIVSDIIPCSAGDTLWLQMVCNANGYQGMIGSQRTFMSVRML
jgi:hypothetical protein